MSGSKRKYEPPFTATTDLSLDDLMVRGKFVTKIPRKDGTIAYKAQHRFTPIGWVEKNLNLGTYDRFLYAVAGHDYHLIKMVGYLKAKELGLNIHSGCYTSPQVQKLVDDQYEPESYPWIMDPSWSKADDPTGRPLKKRMIEPESPQTFEDGTINPEDLIRFQREVVKLLAQPFGPKIQFTFEEQDLEKAFNFLKVVHQNTDDLPTKMELATISLRSDLFSDPIYSKDLAGSGLFNSLIMVPKYGEMLVKMDRVDAASLAARAIVLDLTVPEMDGGKVSKSCFKVTMFWLLFLANMMRIDVTSYQHAVESLPALLTRLQMQI